jgi:hypothetical protein
VTKKPSSEYNPRSFNTELERILAVLLNSQIQGTPWLTASEISATLRDRYGLGIHWRRVASLLLANGEVAGRRKRNRQWQFIALAAGRELISASGNPILFIDPSRALQATLSLHAFLGSLTGTIRICDPYLDSTTLDHLSACAVGCPIRLLTKNVKDGGRLRVLLGAAKVEGRIIEVRVAASAQLHDRYVIDSSRMLILGTSLNGFGKKQGFVVQAGPDVRGVVLQVFDSSWLSATVWA